MKKIYIILLLVIFLTTGCSKVNSRMAEQHLEDKYNEDFAYVKLLDFPVSVFDITNGKDYHFVSQNGDNISVVCGEQGDKYSCVDGYYQYLIYDDMLDMIKTTISKYIPNIKIYMNFTSSIFENSWDKETSLEQALSENSVNLHTYIRVFTYNLNERDISQFEENLWNELKSKGLSLAIYVHNISLDEYSSLQVDNKNVLSKEQYDSFMDTKGYSFEATLSKIIKN